MRMKHSIFNSVFFTFFALMGLFSVAHAQDSTKNSEPSKASIIEKQIENKDFVFVANMVSPAGDMTRNLTDYYSVNIKNDSLKVDLPYFGHADYVPINTTNTSLTFTSTNFVYTVVKKKKGKWDIFIKLKDNDETRSISITAYENGTAYASVTTVNRSPISYDGYLEEKK